VRSYIKTERGLAKVPYGRESDDKPAGFQSSTMNDGYAARVIAVARATIN